MPILREKLMNIVPASGEERKKLQFALAAILQLL